jgi:asparagine synthase (glutamine-hydrolysing)
MRMLAAQEIYGPHDRRQWSADTLAVGRCLFRALPEDAFDRQPLHSRDGRLVLVADARLDNRDELIAALGLPTGRARELCDAAILLAGLDRWGEGALARIVGDFAFALWNASTQTLLLARDFRGRRPLCFHRGRDFFAFASMPNGLHALADIPSAPDEQSIAEFLALLPQHGPCTFFKNIERIEPGHFATVTRDGVASRRYWEPRRPQGARRPSADYIEGLRHHLDQATQARLRGANNVVGAHLSGGLDSAAVTATAARLLAPKGGKVVAFTAVPREDYDGPNRRNRFANEGPLAAATAALYANIDHVLIRSGHISPLAALDRDFFLFGAPVLNLCNGPWSQAINNAARERKLNVMLVGQMGNMTISYGGLELLPELLLQGRLIKLWREASLQVAKAGMSWRGVSARIFGPFMPVPLWQWLNETYVGHRPDISQYSAIKAEQLNARDLPARARARHHDFAYRPWKDSFAMRLWAMRRGDVGNFVKGTLAGWGIDLRDPTADRRLVEYCLSIPTEEFLAGGVQRALAKQALADRLPAVVLNEQRKGYQAADRHDGATAARADIAAELDRAAACALAAAVLDIPRLKRLVENWPSGGWEREAVIRQYRIALLRGISAGHFLRKASGANR